MAETLDPTLIAAALNAALGSLEAHGVLAAHVRICGLDLEVTLADARASVSPPVLDDDDGDDDSDLGDVDPRFALERLNYSKGKAK